MDNCVFCKIIKKQIPSTVIFESDNILGFKDINPAAPTHYVFIPKKHIKSLSEIGPEDTGVLGELFLAIKKTAEKEGFSERGFRTTINTGKEGGQTVFHLHAHFLAGKTHSHSM